MLARCLPLASALLTGCLTVGSGDVVEEARPLDAFSKIESSGSIRVTVEPGEPGAIVSADDNIVPLIVTRVSGDTLEVFTDKSLVSRSPLVVHVKAAQLDALSVSGSGNAQALSVDAEDFDLEISGSGSVTLAGAAKKLEAHLSGSGRLDAGALTAEHVSVRASGSGSARVVATKKLDADVSGSGSVRYGGDPPDVSSDVSGSGSVKPSRSPG